LKIAWLDELLERAEGAGKEGRRERRRERRR